MLEVFKLSKLSSRARACEVKSAVRWVRPPLWTFALRWLWDAASRTKLNIKRLSPTTSTDLTVTPLLILQQDLFISNDTFFSLVFLSPGFHSHGWAWPSSLWPPPRCVQEQPKPMIIKSLLHEPAYLIEYTVKQWQNTLILNRASIPYILNCMRQCVLFENFVYEVSGGIWIPISFSQLALKLSTDKEVIDR